LVYQRHISTADAARRPPVWRASHGAVSATPARRLRDAAAWIGALTLCGCANLADCGAWQHTAADQTPAVASASLDSGVPSRDEPKKRGTRKANGKRVRRPPLNISSGTAWRALTFFVPDVLEGYRARTASDGHDMYLGAGVGFLTVKRAYGKDNVLLELELIDAAHCERVRDLFNHARELQRETDSVVIRPLKVQGQKALVQWLDATRVARVSVLVAERFLLNANLKPAESPAASIALAQKLDWQALEKLALTPAPPLDTAADALEAALPPGGTAPDEPARGPGSETTDAALLASQPE
jgi:hypothetical protein